MHTRSLNTLQLFTGLLLAGSLSLGCAAKSASSKGSSTASAKKTAGGTSASSASGKKPFPDSAPVTPAPKPPAVSQNPLLGAKLFVDPESLAMLQANRLAKTNSTKAAQIHKIADQPQGLWMGEWNTNIFRAVEHYVKRATAKGEVPVVIAYNIPMRDCGQYSAGGMSSGEAYKRWIRNVAAGIGTDPAVVVLEPDALGHFQECLSDAQKAERMELISDAVRVLRQNPKVAVYIDAGHARWVPAEEMAERLKLAGVEDAHGFSLNVSNYVTSEENTAYGKKISALLGGKHFVIDTSRNGAGPVEHPERPEDAWCNPPGRKIGAAPTTKTGEPLCDAWLWLKRPGESDGECNGGPRAGVWWEEQAMELSR